MRLDLRKDYYRILGVKPNSSYLEIRMAYHRLALRCHPDLYPGDAIAEERFKEITEAYEVLKEASTKRRYDQHLPKPFKSDPGLTYNNRRSPGYLVGMEVILFYEILVLLFIVFIMLAIFIA